MRAYEVHAVSAGGVLVLATTDTAFEALVKLKDARTQYRRAWVTDETGQDVSLTELENRAAEEKHKGRDPPLA